MHFRSCVHTHSSFCDGKDAPEVMVKRAVDLGFVSLGFSGHGPCSWDPYAMTQETLPAYTAEIRRLQKEYDGRLEILLGIEHDSLGEPAGDGYDYVIESVHAMEVDGQLCYIDWALDKTQSAIREVFGGDSLAYARAYYQACAAAYERFPADIAGHLDLLTKFNEKEPLINTEDPRYLDAALEAMACALDKGLVPELNSGAISRGYRTTPYPSVPILQYLVQRKAPIVVTSDCHDASFLDCWYDQAAELLKSVGFKSTLRLRKSGWEEVGL